jgi:hypothetical protein
MEKALEWRQSTSRDGAVGRGRKKAVRRGLWPPVVLSRGIILSGEQSFKVIHHLLLLLPVLSASASSFYSSCQLYTFPYVQFAHSTLTLYQARRAVYFLA